MGTISTEPPAAVASPVRARAAGGEPSCRGGGGAPAPARASAANGRERASRPRPALPGWVRVAVSLGLLGALVWMLDPSRIAAAFAAAESWLLAVLLALTVCERLFSAYRWHTVLRWNGADVPLGPVVRISFVSSFLGFLAPGAVGVEALRMVGLARYTSNGALGVTSVVVDRLLSVVAMIPFVLLGLLLSPVDFGAGVHTLVGLAVLTAAAGGLLVMHPAGRRLIDVLTPRPLRPFTRRHAAGLYASLDAYMGRPWLFAWAASQALFAQVLRIAVAMTAAAAMHVEAPLMYFFMFVPVTNLVALMPFSLGGLGVREVGFVYALKMVGVPGELAFGASLLVYIFGGISVLPGAWLCLRGSGVGRKEGRPCTRS